MNITAATQSPIATLEEWRDMTAAERRTYLALLTARQRRELAQELADSTAQDPAPIVRSRVNWQYLTGSQASAVLAVEL